MLYRFLIVDDPFASFRAGFARLMMFLFFVALVLTLVQIGINMMNGERDAAKRLMRWVAVAVLGFIIFGVIAAI